jgi:hypothetical protein
VFQNSKPFLCFPHNALAEPVPPSDCDIYADSKPLPDRPMFRDTFMIPSQKKLDTVISAAYVTNLNWQKNTAVLVL